MKTWIAPWFRLQCTCLFTVALFACTQAVQPPSPIGDREASVQRADVRTVAPRDADGATVARALQARYDSTVASCPGAKPAVLCSGILLRATTRGNYHVWNPNPSSRLPRGVSFSWLRRDSAFTGTVFNYTNGFIVVPYQTAAASPSRYTALAVQCVYAFDSDTYNRTGGLGDGCAAHDTAHRVDTSPCQAQGVFTASQWLAKFRTVVDRYTDQCGFRISDGTPDAAAVFMALPAIRTALSGDVWLHNEVLLSTWAQNDSRVPVEAFYYLRGHADGLAQARANVVDFRAMTGHTVPVIELTLPTSINGPATFTYTP
jgi:hypothetical protein